MKKLIITLALIFIGLSVAYPQSLKRIENTTNLKYVENVYNTVSFRLKPVFTSIKSKSGLENFDNGFGFTSSLQFDLGRMISIFGEINISWFRYVNNNKNHRSPPEYFSGIITSEMINVGTKFYPYKSNVSPYIKAGFGLLVRNSKVAFPPLLNVGIGFEYKLSRIFNLFSELEINYQKDYPVTGTTDLSFGIGTSLYFENF